MKHPTLLQIPAPLLERMDATQQNPRYHREGSVLAHTELVVQRYWEMRDQFELDEDERTVLYWTALLHDVGKTVATVWQDGRWRSPGHERAGVPIALDVLLQHPEVTAALRRRILDLIRWHGFPLNYSRQGEKLDTLKLLGTWTDLKLLGIFSIFDFHGRHCDDRVDVLARVHRFHEHDVPLAEYELGKHWDLQAAFAGWNLRHKNAAWNALVMRDARLLEKLLHAPAQDGPVTRGHKVTLVMGPPLAGKSTWIGEAMKGAFVVDLAEHGVVNELTGNSYLLSRKMVEFKHSLRIFLNRHKHVVMETRSLAEGLRRKLVEVFRDMPAEVDYVVVEAGLEALRTRNLLQPEPMAEAKLDAAYMGMEVIHPWEAHDILYVNG
jgi:predicted kinase